jgi:SAM-dependent methyltransferase
VSVGPPGGEVDEFERLRLEYESSLSWRLTKPVRALGSFARSLRQQTPRDQVSQSITQERVDSWLGHYYGEVLDQLDAACAGGPSAERYALFRELDDELWALLLTQQYEHYPNIRATLPGVPEPALQELWNGFSGLALARQSRSFYTKLRGSYARHGETPLSESAVLDFGCGWGRLTRYLLRDVAPGRLCGCDPVEGILEMCRANRVGASFARSALLPERVPFDEPFDLAFAFSVFTHLSEAAHEASLRALHRSLRPGGILVVTIRPPEYLSQCEAMHPILDALGPEADAALALPRYLFVAHQVDSRHPQADAVEQRHYGETVITMSYVRERWASSFELLEIDLQLDDLHQVVLTLRRK